MARGLFAGGIFLSVMAVFSGILGMFDPYSSWLEQQRWFDDNVCWRGSGIYSVGFTYGEYLDLPHGKGICKEDRPGFESYQSTSDAYCRVESASDFAEQMCTVTIVSKILHFLSILFNFGSLCALLFCYSIVVVEDMILPAQIACLFSGIGMIFSGAILCIMLSSPLFSSEHYSFLSQQMQTPYDGLGCIFQEPFRNRLFLTTMFLNTSNECIMPGSGCVMMATTFTFSLLCAANTILLVRSLTVAHSDTPVHLTRSFPEYLNKAVMDTRHYSLYGAVIRHCSESSAVQMCILSLGVPFVILINAWLTVLWIQTGVRFGLIVSASISSTEILRFKYEVFDFNTVTAVNDFWLGNAYFMSILTFTATFFVPISKFLIWIYMWYIPCDELIRGRVLSWVDYLGKIALANLFMMSLMMVAFLFDCTTDLKMLEYTVTAGIHPGFALWGFILSSSLSLAMGQFFVYFHGIATRWEEVRRYGIEANQTLRRRPSLFQAFDTPSIPASPLQAIPVADLNHHQEFISLCNSVLTPVKGEMHKFSNVGKSLVDFVLGATLVCTVVGMTLPSFRFTREGMVGLYVQDESYKVSEYTMYSLSSTLNTFGLEGHSALALSVPFVLFSMVFPLLHLIGLCVLWRVPLPVLYQERIFKFTEMMASWNSLDILAVCVAATWTQISATGDTFIPQVVPTLDHFTKQYFHTLLYHVEPAVLDGFWVLLTGIILEKLLSMFIIPLSATKIARHKLLVIQHNIALESLDTMFNSAQGEDSIVEEDRLHEEESDRLMQILSPSARYAGASSLPAYLFGGLPRW